MSSNSWSQMYRYTDAEVRRCAPAAGGVYRLLYTQNGSTHAFYVGQSNNLAERLLAHLSSADLNACIRRQVQTGNCYFDFARVSTEAARQQVEAEEIARLRPTCNA